MKTVMMMGMMGAAAIVSGCSGSSFTQTDLAGRRGTRPSVPPRR